MISLSGLAPRAVSRSISLSWWSVTRTGWTLFLAVPGPGDGGESSGAAVGAGGVDRRVPGDRARAYRAAEGLAPEARQGRGIGGVDFEYQVLALLSEAPDRTLRMSELAMWAGSSLPRLSQVVARLEQRGWVRRTPDPGDGRYTLATLTGHGQAKVTQAAPGHVQEVRRLVFDPLTKTQSRQLGEIGRRITRAIDPDDHQPQPAATPAQPPQ